MQFSVYGLTLSMLLLWWTSSATASQGCMPECRWACNDPVCHPICGPACAAPDCTPLCETPPYWNVCKTCEIVCEPADCHLDCGRDQETNEFTVADQCTLESCPRCSTVCAPVQCRFQNCYSESINEICATRDANDLCETQCAHTRCDWSCQAPTRCESPQCELVCQAPACQCDTDTEGACDVLQHYQVQQEDSLTHDENNNNATMPLSATGSSGVRLYASSAIVLKLVLGILVVFH